MEAGRLGKTGMRFGGKRRVMQDAETAHARAETAGLRMGGMSFRVVYAGAVWRAWDAQKRKKRMTFRRHPLWNMAMGAAALMISAAAVCNAGGKWSRARSKSREYGT